MRHSVHLTNAWHGASGGVRTFYEALMAGAERHRRRLTLIVPGERTRCERRGAFTRVYQLRAPRSPFFDRRYRVLLPSQYAGRRSAIWRLIADARPDVVEISDKYVLPFLNGLVRLRAGDGERPTLIGLSSERLDDNVRAWVGGGRAAGALTAAYLHRVYLPLFDGHIANSDYTAEELRVHLRDRREVRIGPMGVDLEGFDPSRRSEGIRQQALATCGAARVMLVYAGRLSPEKHALVLPGMMRRLAQMGVDAALVVCGDGPLRSALQAEGERQAPGRVRILGHLPRPALATLLASADAFIHPNPREPFGIGPLEAMASGLPVVLPRAGGVLMYATDGNSWLTDASEEGFASAVSDLLARPVLRSARRAQALADVQRLSWPAAVDTYFRHYDAIDEARRSRRHLPAAPRALTWRADRLDDRLR